MEVLNLITKIITFVFSALVAYRFIYILIGVFTKNKKYPEATQHKRYAIIISARNEEKVIGNLIASLKAQNYEKELITIFVVADNCDDNTAKVCRDLDCVVYERFDKTRARKGWALEYLFHNIERDFGISYFDGFIIFDADNVVDKDYVRNINNAICAGAEIVIGYRNTKNFKTNAVSAAYGIHFCRAIMSNGRARRFFDTTTNIAGTGYCVASHLLKDGWKWHSLTEDDELTIHSVTHGVKVEFCENAQFYDEQPTSFRVAFRQRIRWTRGRLGNYFSHVGEMIKSMFTLKKGKARWSMYDILMSMTPFPLFILIIGSVYPITSTIITIVHHEPLPWLIWLKGFGYSLLTSYISMFLEGLLVMIRERKHIHCSTNKKILYLFCWPWFDLINIPLLIASCFAKPVWKPIIHTDTTKIEEFEKRIVPQETIEKKDENEEEDLEKVS